MKCYRVTLYDNKKDLTFSYMEFAQTSKQAKAKARLKTDNQVISARAMK